MVEPIPLLSPEERQAAIERAGYNTFLLRSDEVTIDLLSDSGTNALSVQQYADSILAPEAVNTVSLHRLYDAVREVYGKEFCLTFHQGRAAERLIFDAFAKNKKNVLGNSYFLTTLEFARHFELEWHDIIVAEAYDIYSSHSFKGKADLDRAEFVIKKVGPENIAFIRMEANVNIIGGQPFSLENVLALRRLADHFGLLLILDATLLSENAYFIWEKEYDFNPDFPPSKIIRLVSNLFDIVYVSSKRDHIAHSGGLLMTNHCNVFEKLKPVWELYEGIGIAARDIAEIAQGMKESVSENYLASRIDQVRNFGKQLVNFGLPVCIPFGGHAIHLDARKFVSHIEPGNFPAQALAAAYYVVSGVRAMEMGSAALGIDSLTKKNFHPKLEMLRLAIPRRTYTKEHLEYASASLKAVWDNRDKVKGLKIVHDPGILRSFKSQFTLVD